MSKATTQSVAVLKKNTGAERVGTATGETVEQRLGGIQSDIGGLQSDVGRLQGDTGSAQIGHTSEYAAAFVQTISAIHNNRPVELLRFIPDTLHAAIKDYSSSVDVSGYVQAAIDALGANGGTILLPRGRVCVANGLQSTNRTNFKGQGRASQIVVLPDMVADTVFRFANGTSAMFNSFLEDCWIRVEGVVAVKQAIVAEAWQENSGAKRVVISGLTGTGARGIVIRNGYGGAAYLRLEDLEIFGSNMTAGIDVEQISAVGGFVLDVRGATIAGATGAPVASAVRMANDTLLCSGLHVEYATSGIYLQNGSRACVRGITGSANEVENLITLSSTWTGALHAQMLVPNGATTTIRDNVYGAHVTGVVGEYNNSGSTSPSSAKAWVTFDGTTGTIKSGYKVASVVRNATGDYTVNWASPFADTGYAVFVHHNATTQRIALVKEYGKAASQYRFITQEWIGTLTVGATTVDPSDVKVVAYSEH